MILGKWDIIFLKLCIKPIFFVLSIGDLIMVAMIAFPFSMDKTGSNPPSPHSITFLLFFKTKMTSFHTCLGAYMHIERRRVEMGTVHSSLSLLMYTGAKTQGSNKKNNRLIRFKDLK